MRVVAAALLSLLLNVSSMRAADLVVLAPPLFEKPLETLAAQFHRDTGSTVAFSFDSQK